RQLTDAMDLPAVAVEEPDIAGIDRRADPEGKARPVAREDDLLCDAVARQLDLLDRLERRRVVEGQPAVAVLVRVHEQPPSVLVAVAVEIPRRLEHALPMSRRHVVPRDATEVVSLVCRAVEGVTVRSPDGIAVESLPLVRRDVVDLAGRKLDDLEVEVSAELAVVRDGELSGDFDLQIVELASGEETPVRRETRRCAHP